MKWFILGLILGVSIPVSIFLVITYEPPSLYTQSYEWISKSDAEELINTQDITVIDCRGGCKSCAWRRGKLPNAIWDIHPENYYNHTKPILVYDQDGSTKVTDFCENLVNHVYSDIYALSGGFNSWR